MSNGKTRVTVDLSAKDYALLGELEERTEATSKVSALRYALRRMVTIHRLGSDPDPETLKAVATAP